MDTGLVTDYLLECSKRPLPEMMPRKLNVPLDGKFVVSIVGPRRSGKTFYFFQLMKRLEKEGTAMYLNFDDTRLSEVTFKEIREIMRLFVELFGKHPKYIFLDEIQNVENWELAVRELYDALKYVIFLTGSSSKLLSKEVSTQMRGRSLTYLFLPFSFSEFLTFKDFKTDMLVRDDESRLKNLLREYLEFGGFPDVVSSALKEKILKDYFDSILFKDVVERHDVKNLHLVSLIFKQLVNNFSREFSVNALYNTFKSRGAKVSKNTIYTYLNYFEDSVSTFFLKRHSEKLKLKEAWPRKVYLSDTGLSKALKSSEEVGRLMENCVFLHLLRFANEKPFVDIGYYKDAAGREVDFTIKEGPNVNQLIQVTYASEFAEIREGEIRSLLKAQNELKCRKMKVITWDYEDRKTINGEVVDFVPLWKFLLRA